MVATTERRKVSSPPPEQGNNRISGAKTPEHTEWTSNVLTFSRAKSNIPGLEGWGRKKKPSSLPSNQGKSATTHFEYFILTLKRIAFVSSCHVVK